LGEEIKGKTITLPYRKFQAAQKLAADLSEKDLLGEPKEISVSPENIRGCWKKGLLGIDPSMLRIMNDISSCCDTDSSVLLLGETGTGKEVVAKCIHELGSRKDKPLVALNCAAISENLQESTLFGHEKGAFTDAKQKRDGIVKTAGGGTLFLDEIGEMNSSVQARMLRFLESGEYSPVGSNAVTKSDARIVSATSRDIEPSIQNRREDFLKALYYRLAKVKITLQDLYLRPGDLCLLIYYYIKVFNLENDYSIDSVRKWILHRTMWHRWQGNIRDLRDRVEIGCLQTMQAHGKCLQDFRQDFKTEGVEFSYIQDPDPLGKSQLAVIAELSTN